MRMQRRKARRLSKEETGEVDTPIQERTQTMDQLRDGDCENADCEECCCSHTTTHI